MKGSPRVAIHFFIGMSFFISVPQALECLQEHYLTWEQIQLALSQIAFEDERVASPPQTYKPMPKTLNPAPKVDFSWFYSFLYNDNNCA